MLLICIVSSAFGIGIKYASTDLETHYGTNIVRILNCKIYNIGALDLLVADRYSPRGLTEVTRGKNETETFNNILNTIGGFTYNESQNNPSNIKSDGGNCQAISLLIEAYCNKMNITSTIMYTPKHMYNKIKLDGVYYKVDLTKSIMEVIKDE